MRGLQAAGLASGLKVYATCTNGSASAGWLEIPTVDYGPGDNERSHTTNEAIALFETPPGVQWQADWSSARVALDPGPRRVSLFTMVSSYSRRLYTDLTEDQTLPTLLAYHEHAFDWFEGLPVEILYDNPKTIVLARDAAGTHIDWNPRFWDFAQYYGLRPRLCRVYRARTKGKVEAAIKYVKRSFLLGQTFPSLAAANEALGTWIRTVADQRVHGTLHERPINRWPADHAALHPRGSQPRYVLPLTWRRRVGVDGLVTVETNRYSVPAQYIGQDVDILPGLDETLRIYREGLISATTSSIGVRNWPAHSLHPM